MPLRTHFNEMALYIDYFEFVIQLRMSRLRFMQAFYLNGTNKNHSVSTLERFRFIEIQCTYKTTGTYQRQRKIPDSTVFRFI